MIQLQQRFDSPSANLGMVTDFPASSFADYRRRSTERKESKKRSTNLSFDELVDHIKRGYHLTPNDADSAFNLAFAYKTLGKWSESAEASTTALDLYSKTDDPDPTLKLAATYFLRGYAYASLGVKQKGDAALRNFEKAENDYLKALDLKSDYMMVYCYLGVLYAEQWRWAEAEKSLKQAIKLKPRYAGAHHDLGAVYMQSERPRQAIKAFEKAVEYEPKNLLALRHLAESYYEAERWDDARRLLLRVLKLEPKDAASIYKLGGAYLHLGDFRKAEKTLQQALDIDPEDIIAYNNLCLVYYKSGRLWDAAAALHEVLQLDPDNESARAGLSAFQEEMIKVVIDAHMETLDDDIDLDIEELIDDLVEVRETVSDDDLKLLVAPGVVFPDQLTSALVSLLERLKPAMRFDLAGALFERRLLSAGKAAQLIGKDRVAFLKELEKSGSTIVESDEQSADLPPINVEAAVALLQSWNEEDAGEQRETWEYLKKALDEDRLSDRKLFA